MSPLERLAVAGLSLLAIASVYRTAPAYIGLGLCLPGALAACWDARTQKPDTVVILVAALVAWLSLRLALQLGAGIGTPGLVDPADDVRNWLYILVFAPLAALPCADPVARVRLLWLLAMAGFCAGIASFLAFSGVGALWSGERLGFHLNRPLGVGLYAGCFAIMLLFTARLWWNAGGRWRWPLRFGAIALIALFVQVVVGAQNRSNYLGALAVLVFAAASAIAQLLRRERHPGHIAAAVVLGFALLTAVTMPNLDTIAQRSAAERSALSSVLNAGLADAPVASVTVRLRLWQFALARFPQAPLLGHGFGDLSPVIDRELRPQGGLNELESYDHMHSVYLQLLWSQGTIGFALWAALVCLLALHAARAARERPERQALMPAMWATLIFIAVWAAFDYRQSHPDMRFFTILVLLSMRLLAAPAQPPAGAKAAA